MKLRHLFLAAIVAIGMMACNNEDTPQVNNAEATVSVKVIPSSNGAAFKAVGNLSGDGVATKGLDDESKIQQLEVYVFDAITGNLDGDGTGGKGYKTAIIDDGDPAEVTGIIVTPGNKVVMIVANGNIGPKLTKASLEAATKDLPVAADKLPMTGESAVITLNPGQNYYGYPTGTGVSGEKLIEADKPLKIQRVNARVAIVGAELDLPADQLIIFDELKDVQVAMFNVPKASKLFGAPATLAVNSTFQHGQLWTTTATPPTYTGTDIMAASLFDATVTFPITVAAAPHYYVTENISTTTEEKMFIVLRGKPYKDDAPVVSAGLYTDAAGYTYYPVWVNAPGHTYTGDNTGDSKIRRNTQYNISMTIKKIGNPTIDPVQEAFLDVVVDVMEWAVVTQGVTWN